MSNGPTIQIEGYQKFCEILRTLKRGANIPPEMWDDLFTFTAYRRSLEIMEKEMGISRKNFIKWVTKGVTTGPPKLFSRIQWFTNQGRTRGFSHYASEHVDEIQAFIEDFKKSEAESIKWISERLREYLPSTLDIPPSTLYFVFGSGDGRNFYNEATYDVTLAYALGLENTKGMIAHELHHMARNEKYGSWTELKGLKFILTTLEAEGIADMVFSIHSSTLDCQELPIVQMMMQSKEAYTRVDEILRGFDELVSNAYPREPSKNKLYRLFTKNAYHPVGHTMARRIEDCLGRDQLINALGKPLEFFEAHQRSAINSGGHIFSENASRAFRETFG
jgi:hypothetical protein